MSEVKTETYRLSDALVSYVREQQDKLKELARERKEIDAQYAAAVDRVKERFHGTKVELVRHICSIIDVPFDPDDVTKAYAVEVQYLKHGVAFLVVAEEDAPPAPGEMSFYPVSGAPPPKNRLN